jgi:hypothetical protein
MGKARVYSNNAVILIHSQALLTPIPLGELDSFKATSSTSIIKSRPIGFINEQATLQYGGWDLSFDGGKVDWSLAHYYWLQDRQLRAGGVEPEIMISETVLHYNGAIEQYLYKGVTIFGLESDKGEEVKESAKGFSSYRIMSPADTTNVADATNIIRQLLFKTAE